LVFAKTLIKPIIIAKGTTRIVGVIIVKHPVGGAGGGAATICIAAIGKGWRERTRSNEPVVIHHSSFGEDKGRGLGSFVKFLT
jgi:hypothetical protein